MAFANNFIDLTQTLAPSIPDWDGCCGFQIKTIADFDQGDLAKVQVIKTPCGIGTHMDAPCHFVAGAKSIDEIALTELVAEGVVIDVSANADEDYQVSLDDIKAFEQSYGPVPESCFVIANTGWAKHWNDPEKYRNVDTRGVMRFPSYSVEAIDYLLSRNIVGIGIDTLSPDGGDMTFPVHQQILGAGKYIVENLCRLDELPANGFKIIALPMKIAGGSEAPCRIVAQLTS